MFDVKSCRLAVRAIVMFSLPMFAQATAAGGVEQVALGGSHACVVVSGGKLLCWGSNNHGQIGIDEPGADDRGPVTVIESGVTAISAGSAASCAVVRAALICWGQNAGGTIRDGVSGEVLRPVQVVEKGVSAVSMGTGASCAVIGGGLYCWGPNAEGQVGNGEAGDPVQVRAKVIASGVTAVAAGFNHTCAIANGTLSCWGSNAYGQIGTGVVGGYGARVLRPVQVIAGGVTAVSVGAVHTCAVVNGSLQCWGNKESGQIGAGKAEGNAPKPVEVISAGVTAVSAGRVHTCAVVIGALQCWGDNSNGALGSRVPGDIVAQPRQLIASGVTRVSTGGDRTCVLVNGFLRCRGGESIHPYCFLGVGESRCTGAGVNRVYRNHAQFRAFDLGDADLDEGALLRKSCVGELPPLAMRMVETLKIDPPAFARCKVWPADAGRTIVVLAYINTGDLHATSEKAGDLEVLLVDSDDGKVLSRVVQEGVVSNSLTGISIDTADYSVARGVRAFGVRTSYVDSGEQFGFDRGERRTTDAFNLYLPQGTALKAIVQGLILNETRIIEYNRDPDETAAGASCASEKLFTRTLAMSSMASHGYFDMVLKERQVDREKALAGESCDGVMDTRAQSRTYLLRFDGGGYLIPGKELEYSVPTLAAE